MHVKFAENWAEESKRTHNALYSELDLMLRALDRFFNLEDIPPSSAHLTTKNFITELNAGKDAIIKVLSILERVIPAGRKNAYLFQKFAETKFLTSKKKNTYRHEMYKQDSPEKSLYRLYGSFLNLTSIINDLRKNKFIEYMGFKSLGQIISKEIRENTYFNPFRRQLDPELDHIGHPAISDIVRSIPDRDAKKVVSVTFLFLFRFLRHLEYIKYSTLKLSELHPSLLIITLLNSENEVFRSYLKKSVGNLLDQKLGKSLEMLSYQVTMESKRVYQQELNDIFEYGSLPQLRGKIENSHGILKNLLEHTIINLAQHWRPDIKGETIFKAFVTKTEQSVKLRENIYVLSRVLMLLEESTDDPIESVKMLRSLKICMEYFEKTTFKLLRYDDYEEFQAFFVEALAYEMNGEFKKFLMKCQYFIVFLDTTLRHIENRAELKDIPLEVDRSEDVVRQFLTATK